ncbi:MAG TPA: hypothetical protein VGI21_05500 [Streptosporangiaceae bacterium]
MELEAGHIAQLAGRPVGSLTRRDVALGLLSVPPEDAMASLPLLRRRLLAAGNPMSAAFWAATEDVLESLQEGTARTGDVRVWLEATATEPSSMIGLHVWDEPPDRSRLQAELHGRLVRHLEDRLADGELDPDGLAAGDPDAQLIWSRVQEQWMTSPLDDGRVPIDVLRSEQDPGFLAGWDEMDTEALSALQVVLGEVGERPLPPGELTTACATVRAAIGTGEPDARLLITCAGAASRLQPGPDPEWWLTLAAGVVSPAGESADPEANDAIGALCSLQAADWLPVMAALARGGPGTPAAADDLAGYAREYRAEDFDEPAVTELFSYVAALWQALGATDHRQRLTALGWWGLPEAVRRVWAPAT